MDDKLISVLKDCGFSEKEAKIYLTTLELGSAPASTIGRRAGIKRVTAYAILQDLKQQGIAQAVEKSGVTQFQVVSPEVLLKRLESQYVNFQNELPALAALADQYNNKPRLQYYEGVVGLKDLYADLLTSSVTIHAFLGTEVTDADFLEYLYEDFLPQRIASGIKAKVLLGPSPENRKYLKNDKKYLKQSKMIEDDQFNVQTEINLYGPNKVAIAMFGGDEMSGFIVHSAKLYESLMSIFNLVWKQN